MDKSYYEGLLNSFEFDKLEEELSKVDMESMIKKRINPTY